MDPQVPLHASPGGDDGDDAGEVITYQGRPVLSAGKSGVPGR